jgi:hypothetical protein
MHEHALNRRLRILRLWRCSNLPSLETVGNANEESDEMKTYGSRTARRSLLLLAALVSHEAAATIPEQGPGHATVASATASAPVLVRLEPDLLAPRDSIAAAMNACVAAIVARELSSASVRCDKAVSMARTSRDSGSSAVALMNRRAGTRLLAAAVSNRAVLKWLEADASYAQDLVRAKNLAPDLDFVLANLAVLGNESPAVSVVAR